MKQLKTFLILFVSFLSLNCGSGPKVTTCQSMPSIGGFNCSDYKGNKSVLPYSDSSNYGAYPSSDAQSVFDWCAARNKPGTGAPQFTACTSIPKDGGFSCEVESCTLNSQSNGVNCSSIASAFILYADSLKFIAFSQAQNIELLAFCNITIKEK